MLYQSIIFDIIIQYKTSLICVYPTSYHLSFEQLRANYNLPICGLTEI